MIFVLGSGCANCAVCLAFEELERALGVAQRADETRRQLQVSMEEQMKQVEMASEEERKNLQQELTRVKQEVVTIMKVCMPCIRVSYQSGLVFNGFVTFYKNANILKCFF